MPRNMSITTNRGKTIYDGYPTDLRIVIQNHEELREYIVTPDSDYPRLSVIKAKEVKRGVKIR